MRLAARLEDMSLDDMLADIDAPESDEGVDDRAPNKARATPARSGRSDRKRPADEEVLQEEDEDDDNIDDDSDGESEAEENEAEVLQKQMERLGETDPEFYKFLRENDPEALKFDAADIVRKQPLHLA
jgi:nucleolar complex protein 2